MFIDRYLFISKCDWFFSLAEQFTKNYYCVAKCLFTQTVLWMKYISSTRINADKMYIQISITHAVCWDESKKQKKIIYNSLSILKMLEPWNTLPKISLKGLSLCRNSIDPSITVPFFGICIVSDINRTIIYKYLTMPILAQANATLSKSPNWRKCVLFLELS